MIEGFTTVLAASEKDRRDLFVGAGNQLGTVEQNIEKDFWVCWTLDALFNGLQAGGPRLLFKGGTSLSKGYGLIARFSEDIDITVFREDIGQAATVGELEVLSSKKRKERLDAIRAACQAYINGPLCEQLAALLGQTLTTANIPADKGRVEPDASDPDGQSLLFSYPTVTANGADYIRRAVKIECGAKSALDPHAAVIVKPYVADDLPDTPLEIANVTTVDPGFTFWDKVTILHGLRKWWEKRGELKGSGQRVSRHYYDVHRLLSSEQGAAFAANTALGENCVSHARMFFNRPDMDLGSARPGTFALVPHHAMLENLKTDYEAMAGMIFGEVPEFDVIIATVGDLETRLNARRQPENSPPLPG